MDFNPRSREGSDTSGSVPGLLAEYFNPRSREGSDLSLFSFGPHTFYFNPRSREGSDTDGQEARLVQLGFQSTLP